LLALAAPAVAQADATLSVSGTAPHKTLTFTVGDALDHVTYPAPNTGDLVIWDNVGIAVGASGCTAIDAHTANCGAKADFELAAFEFAGGNDQLSVGSAFPIDLSADGGAGDDDLYGGLLDDYLDGGPGDDDLQTAEWPPAADAAISCGPGNDTLIGDDGVDEPPDDCETVDPPYLDGDLRIAGEARVGNVLGLSIPTNVGGDGVATIQWERCDVSPRLRRSWWRARRRSSCATRTPWSTPGAASAARAGSPPTRAGSA
jgi:Ca2+-binding RTX toxin-like protein